MGNVQPSKMLESQSVSHLTHLEVGQFAKIYKGVLDARNVAIKVPKVPESIRKEKKLVKTHIDEVKKLMPNLKRARGEYVVKHLGVAYDDFRKEVWVVREFIDGTDLETLLKNPSLCPFLKGPERKITVALGIAKGISYLHRLRVPILHGDFKLSDVLLSVDGATPKITNFGLWDFKQFFITNAIPEHVEFLNPCQAPEVLLGEERPTLFSDCWSLGAVILHWMTELPPWDLQDLCYRYRLRNNNALAALKNAMGNEEEPTITERIGQEEEVQFLRECLSYHATNRPSALVIEHKLVQTSLAPTWTNLAYHKYYS